MSMVEYYSSSGLIMSRGNFAGSRYLQTASTLIQLVQVEPIGTIIKGRGLIFDEIAARNFFDKFLLPL